jgi:hypothetical protein
VVPNGIVNKFVSFGLIGADYSGDGGAKRKPKNYTTLEYRVYQECFYNNAVESCGNLPPIIGEDLQLSDLHLNVSSKLALKSRL